MIAKRVYDLQIVNSSSITLDYLGNDPTNLDYLGELFIWQNPSCFPALSTYLCFRC